MTLRVTKVMHGEVSFSGETLFHVECEGIDDVIVTKLQSGSENDYNNSVLEAWLVGNTPTAYATSFDTAAEAFEEAKTLYQSKVAMDPVDAAMMTDAEKTSYKELKAAALTEFEAAATTFESADNARMADLENLNAAIQAKRAE